MVEPRSTVLGVLGAVESAGALLVVDEAYGQFAPWSALSLVGEEVPLVVTRTFSKTWSMAAAATRLSDRARMGRRRTRSGRPCRTTSMPPSRSPESSLCDYVDEMNQRVAGLVEERGRLVAALGDLDVDVWPSGANFVLFRPAATRRRPVWPALLERSRAHPQLCDVAGPRWLPSGDRGHRAGEFDAFLAALASVLGEVPAITALEDT